MGRFSSAVHNLVVANAIVFVVTLIRPDLHDRMVEWFACWFPRNEHFAAWQAVTYMFMHGGLTHIAFNMFALFSFGVHLERLWGVRKFLGFYFLCGIGAAVIYTGINWVEFQVVHDRLVDAGTPVSAIEAAMKARPYVGPDGLMYVKIPESMNGLYAIYNGPMVGASGAIYGVLVAFGLLFPNAKLMLMFLPVPIAAKYLIPVLLAMDLLSGVTGFSLFGGGVAHFAHLGGALIGFLLMWYWRNQARRAALSDTRFDA